MQLAKFGLKMRHHLDAQQSQLDHFEFLAAQRHPNELRFSVLSSIRNNPLHRLWKSGLYGKSRSSLLLFVLNVNLPRTQSKFPCGNLRE